MGHPAHVFGADGTARDCALALWQHGCRSQHFRKVLVTDRVSGETPQPKGSKFLPNSFVASLWRGQTETEVLQHSQRAFPTLGASEDFVKAREPGALGHGAFQTFFPTLFFPRPLRSPATFQYPQSPVQSGVARSSWSGLHPLPDLDTVAEVPEEACRGQ